MLLKSSVTKHNYDIARQSSSRARIPNLSVKVLKSTNS